VPLLTTFMSLTLKEPEGRGLQTQLSHCISSIYLILPAALGPGVYTASNRNEYQKQRNNVSGE
jgi:hypothetical protein